MRAIEKKQRLEAVLLLLDDFLNQKKELTCYERRRLNSALKALHALLGYTDAQVDCENLKKSCEFAHISWA